VQITSIQMAQDPMLVNVKKVKQSKIEPETCSVCASNYTAIIRKKIVCKFCTKDTCSKCIEQYLLSRHEDAHCLHCRVNYNDETLYEICTKTYLQQSYFRHRQEVLINRERANLPALQDAALDEKRNRDYHEQIKKMKQEVDRMRDKQHEFVKLYNEISQIYHQKVKDGKNAEEEEHKQTVYIDAENKMSTAIRNKQYEIRELRYQLARGNNDTDEKKETVEEEKKKFIRRCMNNGCQGFLSTVWKCGICEFFSCHKCFAVKAKEHDAPHECKKEDVETAELIKKDSKPCPKCGEFIMKSSGCFAKDTEILMWNGETKMIQDIILGDEVMGDDGYKRVVEDTFVGEDEMYKVTQKTGMEYVVNGKHTLVLHFVADRKIINKKTMYVMRWFNHSNNMIYSKRVRITEEKSKESALKEMEEFRTTIEFPTHIEMLVDVYMKLPDKIKKELDGFKSSGANWEKKDVPLDPYLMGVYIGDGINDGMSFAINAPEDPEILEHVLNWAETHDCEVVHDDIYRFRVRRRGNKINIQKAIGHGATSESCKGCKQKKSGFCDRPAVSYEDEKEFKMTDKKNPLREIVEGYGLVGERKKIPMDYIVNDRQTRLQLLAGIIDADGHLNKMNDGRRLCIVTSLESLSKQIVMLSQSLGFITSVNRIPKKGISFFGKEKKDYPDHFAINISGKISEIPTKLPRKECKNSLVRFDMLNTHINVSPTGRGVYFGISLNGNKLFTSKDFTTLKNCSQMFCITCKTPWDWNTGKIVTNGPLHNPHYYEWMRKSGGGTAPRNPLDVPCGGFPAVWELPTMPRGLHTSSSNIFYEFHRICQEIQQISTQNYQHHINNDSTNAINIRFLLNEFDEKHWGKLLASNEKIRKRDAEIQEVLGAFRMVAVELINRVTSYRDATRTSFSQLTVKEAAQNLTELGVMIHELILMINNAMQKISTSFHYSVPCIEYYKSTIEGRNYYRIITKNYSIAVGKRTVKVEDSDEEDMKEAFDTSRNTELPVVYSNAIDSSASSASSASSVAASSASSVAASSVSSVAAAIIPPPSHTEKIHPTQRMIEEDLEFIDRAIMRAVINGTIS